MIDAAGSPAIPFNQRPTLSIDEAVRYSGLSRSLIYELMGASRIRSTKLGKRRLIVRESLDAVLVGEAA